MLFPYNTNKGDSVMKKLAALLLCLVLLPLSAFAAGQTEITLLGDTAEVTGSGAEVNGNTVTITKKGIYHITGSLSGQLIVDVPEDKKVTLVLDGAQISSDTACPLLILSSPKKTVLDLLGDNTVTDTRTESNLGEYNAAVWSQDDLTVSGSGSLAVSSAAGSGISSKDDIDLESGSVTVSAAGVGIRGTDSVSVTAGSLKITAGGDGIKSTQEEKEGKGFVAVSGGVIDIECGGDGISAATDVTVSGGFLSVVSGGGAEKAAAHTENTRWGMIAETDGGTSQKGLKSDGGLLITDGVLELDCADDALHCAGTLQVDGGIITASTGDDALHSDTQLIINGGEIIAFCYEGLEAPRIIVNGGDVTITAADDGINAAGTDPDYAADSTDEGFTTGPAVPDGAVPAMPDGQNPPDMPDGMTPPDGAAPSMPDGQTPPDGAVPAMPDGQNPPDMPDGMTPSNGTVPAMPDGMMMPGRQTGGAASRWGGMSMGRPGGFGAGDPVGDTTASITINGGTIFVDAGGDGFDTNGTAEMNGGTLIIAGPTDSMNGAIDYQISFNMNGGTLVAAGAAGMAQHISGTSAQPGVFLNVSGNAGTYVQLLREDGTPVLGCLARKQFGCVVISCPEIELNATYSVLTGTSVPEGVADSGLYTGPDPADGVSAGTVTVDSVTAVMGGFGGFGGFGDFGDFGSRGGFGGGHRK